MGHGSMSSFTASMAILGFVAACACASTAFLVCVYMSHRRDRMQDRIRDMERLWERVDDFRKYREESLTTLESRMEKFDLKEQKRRSDCIAEHQRELTRIGSDQPEERARLCAAHREELAGLDQDNAIRRAACLAELEHSYRVCFRPWRVCGVRAICPPDGASAIQSAGNSWSACSTRCTVTVRRGRPRTRPGSGSLASSIAWSAQDWLPNTSSNWPTSDANRPEKRARLLAAHADELADLDQDACNRCTEYRAVKEENG